MFSYQFVVNDKQYKAVCRFHMVTYSHALIKQLSKTKWDCPLITYQIPPFHQEKDMQLGEVVILPYDHIPCFKVSNSGKKAVDEPI